VIDHKRRLFRAFDQIREIWIEAAFAARHGSAIFTWRNSGTGYHQLGTATTCSDWKVFEGEAKKRFMLHYNFPPFSVGESLMRGAAPPKSAMAHFERGCFRVLPAWTIAFACASSPTLWVERSSRWLHLRHRSH